MMSDRQVILMQGDNASTTGYIEVIVQSKDTLNIKQADSTSIATQGSSNPASVTVYYMCQDRSRQPQSTTATTPRSAMQYSILSDCLKVLALQQQRADAGLCLQHHLAQYTTYWPNTPHACSTLPGYNRLNHTCCQSNMLGSCFWQD